MLLCLKCRKVKAGKLRIAMIQPLAWELPYALGVALKSKTKTKTKTPYTTDTHSTHRQTHELCVSTLIYIHTNEEYKYECVMVS